MVYNIRECSEKLTGYQDLDMADNLLFLANKFYNDVEIL